MARLVPFFQLTPTNLDPTCEGKSMARIVFIGAILTPFRYGTGTECDDNCSGTIAAQKYLNTVITLASADTTFGSTIASAGGATYTGLSSSQGGKVWTITQIDIPSMD